MDTTRARTELGWSETRSATSALQELLDGMHDGAGHPTPPLAAPRSWKTSCESAGPVSTNDRTNVWNARSLVETVNAVPPTVAVAVRAAPSTLL